MHGETGSFKFVGCETKYEDLENKSQIYLILDFNLKKTLPLA